MLAFQGDRWRLQADPPRHADALIVLAGHPARARHAANLYLHGFSNAVYVVRPAETAVPPEVEVNRGILMTKGVRPESIHIFEQGALNTVAEANVAFAALPATIRSVMVVTTPLHVRRARMIFEDVLGKRGIEVSVVAPSVDEHPEFWWSRQGAKELAKTVAYAWGMQAP